RGAPQTAGVVDDTHDLEGSGVPCANAPDVQYIKRGNGTRKQRGCPIVRSVRRVPDKDRRDAAFSKRDRGRQARGSAAHYQDREGITPYFWHRAVTPASH